LWTQLLHHTTVHCGYIISQNRGLKESQKKEEGEEEVVGDSRSCMKLQLRPSIKNKRKEAHNRHNKQTIRKQRDMWTDRQQKQPQQRQHQFTK